MYCLFLLRLSLLPCHCVVCSALSDYLYLYCTYLVVLLVFSDHHRHELELILAKYEDRETVRVFIERLVKVCVLSLEMDNKERKLISTTDVDVHTVLERLMISENNEENDCVENTKTRIVREENKWLDDRL